MNTQSELEKFRAAEAEAYELFKAAEAKMFPLRTAWNDLRQEIKRLEMRASIEAELKGAE